MSNSSEDRFLPANRIDHFRGNKRPNDLYPEIIVVDLSFINWWLRHLTRTKINKDLLGRSIMTRVYRDLGQIGAEWQKSNTCRLVSRTSP
jgi:hypothetical protein